jgi:hypothetical protein
MEKTMPLIKHSPEWLEKKARRDKEAEIKQKEAARAKLEEQVVNLYDQITKFKELGIDLRPSTDQRREYEYMIYLFAEYDIPIFEFLILEEAEKLHEILRFAKLSGEFTKDADSYRLIDSIMQKNKQNLFHLSSLKELGLTEYMNRYNLTNTIRRRKGLKFISRSEDKGGK